MKKKDLANKIEKLKGKVAVDNNIKNLCDQVCQIIWSRMKNLVAIL